MRCPRKIGQVVKGVFHRLTEEMEWTPPTPDAERSEGPGGPSWADGIKVLKGKIRSLPRPTEGAR